MKEQFISYASALELKNLGFDEECLAVTDNEGVFEIVTPTKDRNFVCSNTWYSENGNTCVAIPLYQQAFQFFRENYQKCAFIYPLELRNSSIVWDWDIVIPRNEVEQEYNIPYSSTYEEACLSCLDKLIEIVKNEK